MRNFTVRLGIVGAVAAIGASAVAAETWMQGYDAAHTGVSPYEFTPPLALLWKFSSDEAVAEAARRPGVGAPGALPGMPGMMGPQAGGVMGPGAGEMMGPAAGGAGGGMMGPEGMMGPGGIMGPGVPGAQGRARGRLGAAVRATSLPKPLAAPAVAPDRIVFIVGTNAYCVDRLTGAKLWKRSVGAKIYSSPVYHDGYFYIADDQGRIHALRAENGAVEWVFRLDKGVRSGLTLYNDVLYFGCEDKRVYALNLQKRELNWVYSTGGPVRAAPAVWRDTVFAASQDGYLYALSIASGRQRWRVYLDSELIYAPPVVRREKVYVAAGAKVWALDARLGHRRWDFPVSALVTGPLAATDDAVFFADREGAVYCLDASTGRGKWRYPKEGALDPIQTGVSLAGDTVVARAGTTTVLTLDARTGRLVWQYMLPKGPTRIFATTRRGLARGRRGARGRGRGMMLGGAAGGVGGAAGAPGLPGAGRGLGTGLGVRAAEIKMEEVIDPPLVLADNRMYIMGDDCVLYGLEADAPDNVPPRVSDAVLMIEGANKVQFSYAVPIDEIEHFPLRFADVVKVPGAPPVYLSVKVVDMGSGVDPDSLTMTMDGKPLKVTFEPDKGLLWFIHNPKGRSAAALPDGKHNVVIEAADWRGNRGRVQLSFTIDNSMSPPSLARRTGPGGMGGQQGGMGPGGMMGPPGMGGMGPGGMPMAP